LKFVSFINRDGEPTCGIVEDGGVIPVATGDGGGWSPLRRLITDSRASRVRSVGDVIPLSDIELAPPLPDPSKIVAAPVNYVDHKQEMNEDIHIDGLGVFLKAPSSLIGHRGTVPLPYTDRRFDQEGELAIVIGQEASHVPVDRALEHVFGYSCLLDMTMRGGEDRSTRKSFDGFTPMGPWIVTPDEVGALDELRLQTWVNGQLRQDADIKDLIWTVPHLIAYVSSVMRLRPGDVVSTGTPAGVGAVNDGDQVTVEVTKVGRLEVDVSARGAVACPTKGAGRGPVPPSVVTPVRDGSTVSRS
jgi:2-keto-4-pentenoate hydratase/2-oxohepta-3-ene-1,7-dioic acid hydratase in catechol pathway